MIALRNLLSMLDCILELFFVVTPSGSDSMTS